MRPVQHRAIRQERLPVLERFWRSSGIQAVLLFAAAAFVHGNQPPIGAPADALDAFYHGRCAQIVTGACLAGLAALNLMWFAAAIRKILAEAGQDGWGAAATAASAAFAAMLFLILALATALAYAIAGSSDHAVTGSLNDVAWACVVLSSFPRAMLIMAGSFGLWRAGFISNTLFAVCVLAVVLVLAGATTWLSGDWWSPDGLYACVVSPVIGLVWILVVSKVIIRSAPLGTGW